MWTIIVRAVEIRLSLAQFLVRGHFSRPFKLVTRILKSCARNLLVFVDSIPSSIFSECYSRRSLGISLCP